jgi:uncharacterized protein YaiE (UPF0345 family)
MSNTNLSGTVSHNTYFEGKAQSLSLETEMGRATLGVMKKGQYQFGTDTQETIVFVSGTLSTKIPGGNWEKHQKGDTIIIPGGIKFDLDCETDVAYICYYA